MSSTTLNSNLFDEINLDETICDCDLLSERIEDPDRTRAARAAGVAGRRLGQDNERIYGKRLGLDDDRIAQLQEQGAI